MINVTGHSIEDHIDEAIRVQARRSMLRPKKIQVTLEVERIKSIGV